MRAQSWFWFVAGLASAFACGAGSPKVLAAQSAAIETELETRYFFEEGRAGNSDQSEISVRVRGEFTHSWARNRRVLEFIPYALLSDPDEQRTHFDIREASFRGRFGSVEVVAGVSRVFWGVTEAVHLIDVINQTDLVEDFDREDKLGQPMISVGYRSQLGTVTVFGLPFFRERRFPGPAGRLRPAEPIAQEDPTFGPGARDRVDLAIRWQRTVGLLDAGLSYFYGTGREPQFQVRPEAAGRSTLVPRYGLIHQAGVDLQYTSGALLLKHEGVYRGHADRAAADFYAQVSGLEFTTYGVLGSASDVGWLLEYNYASEVNALTPFDNDLFVGLRWAFNDLDGTELVGGAVFDLDSNGKFVTLEMRRRLSSAMFARLELRQFISTEGVLEALETESYAGLTIGYTLSSR